MAEQRKTGVRQNDGRQGGLRQKITGGQFRTEMRQARAGAFLFFGDENFLKRRELESLRDKICADENAAAFNHFIFTNDNYEPSAVRTAILAPAMMADLKLVEIYALPFGDFRKKDDLEGIENWLQAAKDSVDTLTVVYTTVETFDSGDAKSPSAIYKLIAKYAIPVEFAHEPTQKLVMWVSKHFSADKIIAEPSECTYLIDTVGHDMTTLANEIDKLCAFLHFKNVERLEKSHIDLVCPHNKEIGAFEFADAVLENNLDKAFNILGDMKKRGESVQVILGGIAKIYTDLMLLKTFSDAGVGSDEAAKRLGLHPFVAKLRMTKAKLCDERALSAVIRLCADTDAALKSGSADDYLMLERLIIQAGLLRNRRVWN